MKILQYHYQDVEKPGWQFDNVEFGKINLLVGNTASGKTRLLNTIFNLGRFVASKEFKHGSWGMAFEHAGKTYSWRLLTEKREGDNESGIIVEDYLWVHEGQSKVALIEREHDTFIFLGNRLPKLSPDENSISLLQEEEVIQPLHQAFSQISRRRFFHDALAKISELQALPTSLLQSMEKKKDLDKLFHSGLNLNAILFVLWEYFNDKYKLLIDRYREVFPFVQEARVTDLSKLQPNIAVASRVPVFTIKERGSDEWIPITDMSSGMQKVLLILADIFILPNNSVYLIDEYENSLGMNAIDFFPEFILELEKNIQFFITSHHPYIINEIPIKDWYVFHRNGMRVSIKYGKEVVERFGRSKQQAFIQLINDPFYAQGVE
jgi:AAA15 family ATPase/GTPase